MFWYGTECDSGALSRKEKADQKSTKKSTMSARRDGRLSDSHELVIAGARNERGKESEVEE